MCDNSPRRAPTDPRGVSVSTRWIDRAQVGGPVPDDARTLPAEPITPPGTGPGHDDVGPR